MPSKNRYVTISLDSMRRGIWISIENTHKKRWYTAEYEVTYLSTRTNRWRKKQISKTEIKPKSIYREQILIPTDGSNRSSKWKIRIIDIYRT